MLVALLLLMICYDKEILAVLAEAGEAGLKLEKIARHVYNACNSIFSPIDYADVYKYVAQYVIKNSRSAYSLIIRADVRGVYLLNNRCSAKRQLILPFSEEELPTSKNAPRDQSLSLW